MKNVRGNTGGAHLNDVHRHFDPDRTFWGSRMVALVAAGVVGFFVTIASFVSLPAPGGPTHTAATRRLQELQGNQADADEIPSVILFRVSPHSVAFSWASPGDSLFRSYEVHCSPTSPFTPSTLTRYAQPLTAESAMSIEVPGLQCATTYFFKVRVNYRDGRFVDTPELVARTGPCPDTTLASGYGTGHGRSSYGGAADSLDSESGDWNSGFSDSTGGTPYSWYSRWDSTVTARAASADSGYRGGAGDLPPAGQEPATLFPPAFVTDSGADIIWSESHSDQFRSYQVHAARTPGFTPSAATQNGSDLTSRYRSRVRLDGLVCGSVYYVKVRTIFRDGRTVDSNEVTLRTSPCR